MPRVRSPRRRGKLAPEKAGQLRAADPFDLIRLLARSQHDPRKAVAELVQNSLDAGAAHVVVVRFQQRGVKCISIRDDGEGVLPGMGRKDALNYIATNIGHSRKGELSAKERYQLLLQGKYGIGLLGFWSVGRLMEMRTRVGPEPVRVLRLEEDSPRFEIHQDRKELELGDTWTEVVVVELHDAVVRQLTGRRLSDYLAEELRGQLLQREVELRVVDQLARGRARREFQVIPRRYRGVPLPELQLLMVEGHGRARLELYYVPPELDEPARVALAAGGTLVIEDLASVPGLDHPPWSGGRLVGLVDFAELDVAPGSRRGFVPNAAAAALVQALRALEPALQAALGRYEEERKRESDEGLLRQLRQVFRDFGRRLPHYELFEVEGPPERGGPGSGDDRTAEEARPAQALVAAQQPEPGGLTAEPAQVELFPPGPLATVAIRPDGGSIEADRSRRLTGLARDEAGRQISEGVGFHWRLELGWALASLIGRDDGSTAHSPRPGLDVVDAGLGVRLLAGQQVGRVQVQLLAVEGGREARAAASFEIVAPVDDAPGRQQGIPEPHPLHAPGEAWRSRLVEGRWEYNSGHPDYLATVGDDQRKLRYIATLLAKELVQRRCQRPGADAVLEQMVEVLSWVERKLPGAPRRRR